MRDQVRERTIADGVALHYVRTVLRERKTNTILILLFRTPTKILWIKHLERWKPSSTVEFVQNFWCR